MLTTTPRSPWLCLIAAIAVAASAHAQPYTNPEVWICPKKDAAVDLLVPGDDWPNLRQRVAGVKLYIDWIHTADSSWLRRVAGLQVTYGLKVTVECGGTVAFAGLDENNGVNAAAIELSKILKLYQAGGWVDYLDIDGPIRRLLWPKLADTEWNGFRHSDFTVQTAADQLMNYLDAVKTTIETGYPQHPIQFNLLTNFANWGYRGGPSYHNRTRVDGTQILHTGNDPPYGQDQGDYFDVLTTVMATIAADPRGLAFAGLTVDIPYDYIMGIRWTPARTPPWEPSTVDWFARVRDLESVAKGYGLAFNLIVNSERGGNTSDQLFYNDTLAMAELYRGRGGLADALRVQSWYAYPVTITPETAPYAMTALTHAVGHAMSPAGLSDRDNDGDVDLDDFAQFTPLVAGPNQPLVNYSADVDGDGDCDLDDVALFIASFTGSL